MWIMISGPYTSGARTLEERAANLREMNRAAAEVFALGHVPVIGVNMALPVIEAAGDDAFDHIMMPLSLALAERCDACLRIGGPSQGADEEAERFRERGKPVYNSLEELRMLDPGSLALA
jgi:hypothetical protein